jgi:hypothetical protein
MVKRAFRNLGAVKGADHPADADDTLIWRKARDLDRLIMGARHLPNINDLSDFAILASFLRQVRVQTALGDAGVGGGWMNTIGKLNVGVVPYAG